MSRCFPFPPPGYENKARTDDVNLLKKGNNRESKQEKKHREKSEGKKKREKDKRYGRHRDTKEKKEKHREKKDKDKDKDKSSVSDEKILYGEFQYDNTDQTTNERKLSEKSKASSGVTRNVDRNCVSVEKKFAGRYLGCNGQETKQSIHLAATSSVIDQELSRRNKVDETEAFSQPVEKLNVIEGRSVASTTAISAEGIEKNKKGNNGKSYGLDRGDNMRITGNAFHAFQNPSGLVQTKIDRVPKLMEKDDRKLVEIRGKVKKRENNDKHRDKYKDKIKEEKRLEKEKGSVEEEEKGNKEFELKNIEQGKLKESNKVDFLGSQHVRASLLAKEITKSAILQESLKKRKESDANGFLCANDIEKPTKLPKPLSSLHLVTENGKMVQSFQNSTPSTSGGQGAATTPKMNVREGKINGVVEAQASSVSLSAKPMSTTAEPLPANSQKYQNFEMLEKKPHPDSKFLSEVLSVPIMKQWPEFDDQEWLFQSENPQPKKPKVGTEVGVVAQVWSEALSIESADVFAMPYVIPY
ncbi:hypothetical protein K2173_018987 [Erythroxylum novogranatense]|uniref:Uncharacterized protein n=1 Tax=Erythroxylum novogranatense TaxID=1862640 RepID=A0AAV8STK4_9ROSI|nr:hypothetical protein K2173_018987 [Erythroxylum novogranatense]